MQCAIAVRNVRMSQRGCVLVCGTAQIEWRWRKQDTTTQITNPTASPLRRRHHYNPVMSREHSRVDSTKRFTYTSLVHRSALESTISKVRSQRKPRAVSDELCQRVVTEGLNLTGHRTGDAFIVLKIQTL
jgi:hypothetical protein